MTLLRLASLLDMPSFFIAEPEFYHPSVERNPIIVQATSREEAAEYYLRTFVLGEEGFYEAIYTDYEWDQSFYTDAEDPLIDYGDHTKPPVPLYDEAEEKRRFVDKIIDFFGDHHDWARMYLDMYYDPEVEGLPHEETGTLRRSKHPFPQEMRRYMWRKWGSIDEFVIVNLDTLEKIDTRV